MAPIHLATELETEIAGDTVGRLHSHKPTREGSLWEIVDFEEGTDRAPR